MARQGYGQTWWGEQWLNALTHIDYDNRLPRGRSYANKGAVKSLEIRGNVIGAKVKGSRPRPYDVAITVPVIPKDKIKILLDSLASDPAIIAKMLNRELDPVVLDKATQLGVGVFPKQWKDLNMTCSCPDWAVPCKHLAAAIYLVTREIDGNPFLVFSLRGIDLSTALKDRGISIRSEANVPLPETKDFFSFQPDNVVATHEQATNAPDFSTINNLLDTLIRVLPAKPAFFPYGDFRQLYEKILKRTSRAARQALDAPHVDAEAADEPPLAKRHNAVQVNRILPGFHPEDKPLIEINEEYKTTLKGMLEISDWDDFVAALQRMNAARLPDFQPEISALYYVFLASQHFLAQSALFPQLFAASPGETGLRWLPATLDESVSKLMLQLAAILPTGMTIHRSGSKKETLTGDVQANVLCSLFLKHFVRKWSNSSAEKPVGDKIISLFFETGYATFDSSGEGAIAGGIQAWLSRFHLSRQNNSPVLWLDEAEESDCFTLDIGIENRETSLEKPTHLLDILADKAWESTRYGLLQTIVLLSEFFPPLNGYISAGAKQPVRLSSESLPSFLFDTLPIIRLLGIRALLPKSLDHILRPRLSMQVSGKAMVSGGFLNADDIFSFDWKIALGSSLLTRDEFENLVRNASGIIRFKSEYVYLDPDEIERLRAQLEKPLPYSQAELLRVALAEEFAGAPIRLDDEARRIIRELTEIGDVPLPEKLTATLRPYQERGFSWIYRNIRAGFGSVIADDMGLGKTLQVITTLLKLKEEGTLESGKALVVVPTSLLTNWQKELARFAPSLSVDIYHGAKRLISKDCPDVLLTTYSVARTDLASLKKASWQIVIVDEAQNIKNPAAAQTRAIKAIPARSFIAMSGTPVENRLSEYWSIMDFANRGYLGNLSHFNKEFAVPIQTHRNQHTALRFQKVTAPFLLRRLKSDKSIISDLPDKIEQDEFCELTNEQTALYESVVREGLKVICGESETFKRQGLVLQMILALKQICNHPAQYLKKGNDKAQLSGKASLFLDLLDNIHANHEKVLVFTQFREMGSLLSRWIAERNGREPLFLHGGVSRIKRDQMVEKFQNDRTERVFILSLKAGGTGLNLTAASNVIHYDLWWNPAVEAQATDRAYRIGQLRNVQVHRFITRATFEERINEMIRSKRELASLTLGVGENWIGNLNNNELRDLFSLG